MTRFVLRVFVCLPLGSSGFLIALGMCELLGFLGHRLIDCLPIWHLDTPTTQVKLPTVLLSRHGQFRYIGTGLCRQR
jgi:hypothetical protein